MLCYPKAELTITSQNRGRRSAGCPRTTDTRPSARPTNEGRCGLPANRS
jgi:hypothetical protein